MAITGRIPSSTSLLPNDLRIPTRTQPSYLSILLMFHISLLLLPSQAKSKVHSHSLQKSTTHSESRKNKTEATIPTMSEILEASRAQNLDLQLQTLGPFFRIIAKSLGTQKELGKAEGLIRVWLRGKILHLESIRLMRETLGIEKSIFGIGLFIGAAAIRYGYDCGCKTAQLLAINDSDLYHSKICTCLKSSILRRSTGSSVQNLHLPEELGPPSQHWVLRPDLHLPEELGPPSQHFQLDNNHFDGTTIPASYSNMSKLLKLEQIEKQTNSQAQTNLSPALLKDIAVCRAAAKNVWQGLEERASGQHG